MPSRLSERAKRGDCHYGAHSVVATGQLDCSRRTIRESVHANLSFDQARLLEEIEHLGQIFGFLDSVGDPITGGKSMSSKIDRHGPITVPGECGRRADHILAAPIRSVYQEDRANRRVVARPGVSDRDQQLGWRWPDGHPESLVKWP